MKIAIVLTGVTHGYVEDTCKYDVPRNFYDCAPNIKKFLIDPLKEQFNDVKIYLTTYENEVINDVIDFYKPNKCTLVPYKDSQMITTYLSSMESLKDEDIDFIFSTRFDILFKSKITTWNINYSKFNVTFKEADTYMTEEEKNFNFTSDCIFAFPKRYLGSLKIGLREAWQFHPQPYFRKNMHPVAYNVSKIIGNYNINFLTDKKMTSDDNDFFILYRVKVHRYGLDYEVEEKESPYE
jgi:hypothetical protein